MSYRDIQLDRPPPLSFRVRSWLRRCALGRAVYRRRWNRMADVLVLSFPKAGRTWIHVMLSKALAMHFGIDDGGPVKLKDLAARHDDIPLIRFRHDDNPHLKTPEELVPCKSEYADQRVVLMTRGICDMAVSMYYQATRRDHRFGGDIGEYVRCRRGSVASMIRFYSIWWSERQVPADFMLLRYEDLHAGAEAELRRVLAFVGVDGVSDAVVREAVRFAGFENMRKMEMADAVAGHWLHPGDERSPESFKTRRGEVGAYRDYLSEADIAMIERMIAEADCNFVY